jgi:transcriptional regulator with XRE-family HTH domain
VDDRRLGLQIRALRRRRNWRQADLADAAHVSQSMVSLVERGHLDGVAVRTLRAILAALDARLDLGIRWRGGALDRLIDERHATLANLIVGILTLLGWATAVEVSFNHFGDRGSIDILAFHPVLATLLVIEVKSEITSVEETARRLHVKVRVASQAALESRGWRARRVAAILVLPEGTAARNALRRFDAIFRTTFPARGRELRQWLRHPESEVRGIWLLTPTSTSGVMSKTRTPDRVRKPSKANPPTR